MWNIGDQTDRRASTFFLIYVGIGRTLDQGTIGPYIPIGLHPFPDTYTHLSISPVIDYGGQYVHTSYKGWRRAGVALTWKFGGYTEKRREAVDTGRFKQ